jgi:hypothetical protein
LFALSAVGEKLPHGVGQRKLPYTVQSIGRPRYEENEGGGLGIGLGAILFPFSDGPLVSMPSHTTRVRQITPYTGRHPVLLPY